jgi:hypothetical protein
MTGPAAHKGTPADGTGDGRSHDGHGEPGRSGAATGRRPDGGSSAPKAHKSRCNHGIRHCRPGHGTGVPACRPPHKPYFRYAIALCIARTKTGPLTFAMASLAGGIGHVEIDTAALGPAAHGPLTCFFPCSLALAADSPHSPDCALGAVFILRPKLASMAKHDKTA